MAESHATKMIKSDSKTEWDMSKRYKEASVKCEFCGDTFNTWKMYLAHAQMNHQEEVKKKWKPCPHCPNFFPSKVGMSTHMAKVHANNDLRDASGRFPCDYCNKSYRNMLDFNKHNHKDHLEKIKVDWVACSECDLCFRNESGLAQHQRNKHKKEQKKNQRVFQCSFCPKIFLSIDPMYLHANRYHLEQVEKHWHFDPGPKMYFPKTPEERKRPESNIPRIYCEFCSANVTYTYIPHANKLHLEIISKLWVECEYCKMFFPSPESLFGHKASKHAKAKVKAVKKRNVSKKEISCEFCHQSFQKRKLHLAHAEKEHPELVSQHWHKCPECPAAFPSLVLLGGHIGGKHPLARGQTGGPRLNCEFCPASFSKVSSLTLHGNSYHPEEIKDKWLPCPVCSYFLSSENALLAHKSRHINGISTVVKCSFCSLKLEDQNKFAEHANQVHLDEVSPIWRYCDQCSLYFPFSKHNHFKERGKHFNKVCNFCSWKGLKHDDYIKHCNQDHMNIITTDWLPCEICLHFLPTEVDLDTHIKRKHKKIKREIEQTKIKEGKRRKKVKSEKLDEQEFPFPNDSMSNGNSTNDNSDDDVPLSTLRRKETKKSKPIQVKLEIEIHEDEINSNFQESNDYKFKNDLEEEEYYDYQDGLSDEDWGFTEECDEELEGSADPDQPVERPEMNRVSAKTDQPVFDISQVQIESEDYDDPNPNVAKKRMSEAQESSSGKRCSYKVPMNLQGIKLVTTVDKNGSETKRVQCEYCPKTHINVHIYMKHVNADHPEFAMLYWLPCDSCNKYMPNKVSLEKHQSNAHKERLARGKKFLCDYCSSTHSGIVSLYRHARTKHFEIISNIWLKCKLCDALLPNEQSLTGHTVSKHPRYYQKVEAFKKSIAPKCKRRGKKIDGTCEFCGNKYYTRSSFLHHIKTTHTEEISHKTNSVVNCSFCDDVFECHEKFYSHISKTHFAEASAGGWISCLYCTTFLPNEFRYAIHRSLQHLSDAHKPFQSAAHLSGRFSCHFCSDTFTAQQSLLNHINKSHIDRIVADKWDCCPGCRKYVKPDHLKFHLPFCIKLNPPVPVKCEFCDVTCRTKLKYHQHANSKHGEILSEVSWLLCQSCKDYFPIPEDLKIHKLVCGKGLKLKNQKLLEVDDGSANISCPFCILTFSHNHNLRQHLNQKHREQLLASNWIPCTNCQKLFANMEGLTIHMRACLQPKPAEVATEKTPQRRPKIKCQHCSELFQHSKYLKHMEDEHFEVIKNTWVQCVECPRYFPDKTAMRRHISLKSGKSQTEQKPKVIKCSYCSVSYVKNWPFTIHNNEKHLDEIVRDKWVLCPRCEKYLPKNVNLKRHLGNCVGKKTPKDS